MPRAQTRPASRLATLLPALALALASLLAGPARAQLDGTGPRFFDFDAGDLEYRTHLYCWFWDVQAPQITLVPGSYIGGRALLETAYGEPGWSKLLQLKGHNVYSLDMVGAHETDPLPGNDLVTLIDKGLWGVYQMGMGTQPHIMLGQGPHAAYVITARARDPKVAMAGILLDPWGPQGAQPLVDTDPADVYERHERLQDTLWREWGLGPAYGELDGEKDLDQAGFDAFYDAFIDPAQPPYWAAAVTGLDTQLRVNQELYLQGWPVLVVRTPAADDEQIAREEAVVAWLAERGVELQRLDLSTVPGLEGVTGIPYAGRKAAEVLEAMWPWMEEQLSRPRPTPGR